MGDRLTTLIESFDGRAVITRYDRPTGTWIFICIHDDTLGHATGGTRMRRYDDPADGLLDAMRLARGMTQKWAALEQPFGGAKAVMAISHPLEGDERRGLLERYGELIASLGGIFSTGEDLGTTPEDFAVIASRPSYVHGFDPETRRKIDPGPFTARGVFSGMRAGADEVFDDGLAGRSVMIQGVGHVGGRLAELAREAGASILVTDLDADLAGSVASRVGGEVVPAAEAYGAQCDVYAPCAVGATLNEDTIPSLRCRLVAGSANNQLATQADADRLHERGIVYAPDYVINGGGALAFALLGQGERDMDVVMERMEDVGQRIGELLREARERGESPVASADRRVETILDRARRSA
jgi:leucine dehydrogenase